MSCAAIILFGFWVVLGGTLKPTWAGTWTVDIAAMDALEVRLTKTQGKQGGFGVAKVSIDSYRMVQPDIL